MKIKSKLIQRIIIGKAIGAIFGGIAFFVIPYIFNDVSMFLRFGVWLWYITLGAIIGIFGILTYHPYLKLSINFWFRGIFLGGWMNFVLCLFAYNSLVDMMKETVFNGYSPFWIIVEGMIFGIITEFIATKISGEGKDLIKKD
ncbi:MAG: hypothetical protein PHN31_04005 [Candidatus Gracilibacteria bacterium]|nr:hypothetical protein [Candidatus Gracilibacteria bacterium]